MTDTAQNPYLLELLRGLQEQLSEMQRTSELRHSDNLKRFDKITEAIGEFKAAVAPVPELVDNVDQLMTAKNKGVGVIAGISLLGGGAGGAAITAFFSKALAKFGGG
jgi:hypothetical protein